MLLISCCSAKMVGLVVRCSGYEINNDVPGSSSPSPPSFSRAAEQWPAWPSVPAGRSSPPPVSGTWTNPLLCHTSCARNTHTETERSTHTLIMFILTNTYSWMCIYRDTHWYSSSVKSNTDTLEWVDTVSKQRRTTTEAPVTPSPEGLCGKCWYPGMFWISKVAL